MKKNLLDHCNVRRVAVQLIATVCSAAATAAWAQPLQTPCTEQNTVSADVAAIDQPMVFNRLGAQNVNWQMYALWHDLVQKPSRRFDQPLATLADRDLRALTEAMRKDPVFAPQSSGLPTLPDTRSIPILDRIALLRQVDRMERFDPARFRNVLDRLFEPPAPLPDFDAADFKQLSGRVTLRPDLRPRPLVLRVAAGGCLRVRFVNLLTAVSNPFEATKNEPYAGHPANARSRQALANIDDQVASRTAGFHPQGLELVRSIDDDSSYVGANKNSLAEPGAKREYLFFAPNEGTFFVSNPGAVFGGEGTAGSSGTGLFGLVAVQPKGARFYRSQVTEVELRLATRTDSSGQPMTTPQGHPVVNYDARYPNDCPSGVWCREGKAGRPILAMVDSGRLIHGEVNAIIVGPNEDGSFPPETYPLEKTQNRRNPTLPNRLEPFREFVSLFHDENAAAQAFPNLFDHPVLGHTLHGVRDAFMINYGSGGVGAEVIANRLQVGPMHDCVDCAFEEFFLSSFTVGDPAMLVDRPANLGLEFLKPAIDLSPPDLVGLPADFSLPADQRGPKANFAYYPHDPANVHHSYLGDFVKFRNAHAGKEQHIFHLHNHQWLYNPNDDNANYIDAQAIGPGSGYTYEIAFGGSGNRNRSAGDAVFHCHYYPHFAQGMWYLWRIHDTFEAGSRLEVTSEGGAHTQPFALANGRPAKGARALPDGEIAAGTPIPALVPLPGKALPPMPGEVEVVLNPRTAPNGKPVGSLAKVVNREVNPGFPFWIAGIEHVVGSRPPTPPLDMDASVGGADGGVPRHAVEGYSAGSVAESTLTRLSADKHEKKVKPVYFAETGTDLERVAMKFHATREHPSSALPLSASAAVQPVVFKTNGAPPTPGAPFFDPCIDDSGKPLSKNEPGRFFDATVDSRSMVQRQQSGDLFGLGVKGTSQFDAAHPRTYKGANIQLDVVFNKLGQHYPQQRILALWGDVADTLDKKRPPEPLVMRMNTFDCARYLHTNLVPKTFELDDYQIKTPTDIIGQHIHLPKWDLPSADGSANGWNYEDGTFSPGMVRSRIHAINAFNAAAGANSVPNPYTNDNAPLVPRAHYYFGRLQGHQLPSCEAEWANLGYEEFKKKFDRPGQCDWLGARTTIQRWFSDPIVNAKLEHRGLGITFTHDHLGPSTHQQVGLYATMLTEPPGSLWKHNETGELLYDTARRDDGGPTSWQAVITGEGGKLDFNNDGIEDSHREFFLQFGDFQHAYAKDVYVGVDKNGVPKKPTEDDFRFAVNPSSRKPSNPQFPDVIAHHDKCPGSGVSWKHQVGREADGSPRYQTETMPRIPRPCPEVISADDVGMMVVNYRNEPVAARVFDPKRAGPDGKIGAQASGTAGDLAFAYQTRTDRKIPALNTVLGDTPYPALTNAVLPGDPFTPILRAYSGDLVRVKVQAGSHEHEHNMTVHGMKWLQGGSGYGKAPTSGWRNSQNIGLSEQFTLSAPVVDYSVKSEFGSDRMYSVDISQDGLWNGVWGVMRTLQRRNPAPDRDPSRDDQDRLVALPQNPLPTVLALNEGQVRLNDCPKGAPVRRYRVSAVLANRALAPVPGFNLLAPPGSAIDKAGGTLVFNPRTTALTLNVFDDNGALIRTEQFGAGPLHDPTAILFVRDEDLDPSGRLRPEAALEPLVLRAAAGECILVELTNRLPRNPADMPDLPGFTTLTPLITRGDPLSGSEVTSFNNNLLRPSNVIGLHPQLVEYDVHEYDGAAVGINTSSMVPAGLTKIYQWFAGGLQIEQFDLASCKPEVATTAALSYVDLNRVRQQWTTLGGISRRLRPATLLVTPDVLANLVNTQLKAQISRDEMASVLETAQLRELMLGSGSAVLQPQGIPAADAGLLDQDSAPLLTPAATFDRARTRNTQLQRLQSITQTERALSQALLSAPQGQRLVAEAGRAEAGRLAESLADSFQFNVPQRSAPAAPGRSSTLRTPPADLGLRPLTSLNSRARVEGNIRGLLGSATTPELSAQLLALPEVRACLETGAADAARRAECVRATRLPLTESLAGSPQLVEQLGRRKLQEAAKRIAESLSVLVPEFDLDASLEDSLSAFRWWTNKPQPPLSPETTRLVRLNDQCRFVGIEFGASNLTPPDRIKQGQKGAVGALVVLPEGSRWSETKDDSTADRQHAGGASPGRRAMRSTATVVHPVASASGTTVHGFRDLVAVHQKGLNLRYGRPDDSRRQRFGAVEVLSAERMGDEENPTNIAPEDAHDAGHMAVNYGAEPMWFRFGIVADAPFGHGGKVDSAGKVKPAEGLGGFWSGFQSFSNDCCDTSPDPALAGYTGEKRPPSSSGTPNVGDPAVPVFTVPAGSQARLRTLMPTGVGRGSTMHVHGHVWRRDPHLTGKTGALQVESKCLGANPLAMWLGAQDSLTPMAHFDLLLDKAGGVNAVTGDFLFRDQAGFGITNGIWSIVRVQPAQAGPLMTAMSQPLRTTCE
jgi:hypothetical protein